MNCTISLFFPLFLFPFIPLIIFLFHLYTWFKLNLSFFSLESPIHLYLPFKLLTLLQDRITHLRLLMLEWHSHLQAPTPVAAIPLYAFYFTSALSVCTWYWWWWLISLWIWGCCWIWWQRGQRMALSLLGSISGRIWCSISRWLYS